MYMVPVVICTRKDYAVSVYSTRERETDMDREQERGRERERERGREGGACKYLPIQNHKRVTMSCS